MKAGTCAHDRHALQQLALNVHVKHSDLNRTRHLVQYSEGFGFQGLISVVETV